MGFDGPLAYAENVSDLLARVAFDDQFHDLALARSQAETWLSEMPLMPVALTRSSTERVETPWTWASWISATRRDARNPGK